MELSLITHPERQNVSLARTSPFHALATIRAPPAPAESTSQRTPISLVCVIDRSGSMAGDKIELVKKSCEFIIEQLDKNDFLSVVSYDSDIRADFALTQMTPANKKKCLAAVRKMEAGTSTNLCGGLAEGIAQAKLAKTTVTSVILLTDGLANQGIVVPTAIVAEMKRLMPASQQMTVFSFGFGADHDASLLKAIAEQGSGLYYFIKDKKDVVTSFADCLGGLLSIMAQEMKLTITPLNGTKILDVMGVVKEKRQPKAAGGEGDEAEDQEDASEDPQPSVSAPKRARRSTKQDAKESKESEFAVTEADSEPEDSGDAAPKTVLLGDIYAEEGRDIVCRLNLPPINAPDAEFEAVEFRLSYTNLLTNSAATVTSTLKIARSDDKTAAQRNVEVDKQINRIKATEVMERSAKLIADKNGVEAAKILKECAQSIRDSVSASDPLCQSLIGDLEQLAEDAVSDKNESGMAADLACITTSYVRQRAAGSSAKKAFSTKAKSDMQKRARKFVGRGKGGKGLGTMADEDDEEAQDDLDDQMDLDVVVKPQATKKRGRASDQDDEDEVAVFSKPKRAKADKLPNNSKADKPQFKSKAKGKAK